MLDAELFIEVPATMSLVDPRIEHEIQLNETSDSARIQFLISDVSLVESTLLLKSSCGEDCNITVHITAEDSLANALMNSTEMLLPFKPYSGSFHYVTLRMLSGNMSNVIIQLIDDTRVNENDRISLVQVMRKSFPEFFLFDYEHLHENDTKPQPFNVTTDALSVLSFEIYPVYDVGGTVTLGLKLIDVEEKYKTNIVLVACVSLGLYSISILIA